MTFASPPERKDFKSDKEFEKAKKDFFKAFDDAMRQSRFGKYNL